MLNALKAETLLELGMRLGEGSGAAMSVPLLRLACALHNEMAYVCGGRGVGENLTALAKSQRRLITAP